jgi:hypothetical protein
MYDTLADARETIAAAGKVDITLGHYFGGAQDLSYLHAYVVKEACKLYDVPASIFKNATLYSTTLLRDFVHRALFGNEHSGYFKNFGFHPDIQDVAAGLRYPASESCGLMGYQLWRVYQSFGYEAERINSIEGDIGRAIATHVTTQVFLKDLGKYAIQDSTFNCLFTNGSGVPLSYTELRSANARHEQVELEHTPVYLRWREWGLTVEDLTGDRAYYQKYVHDAMLGPWTKVLYSWDMTGVSGHTLGAAGIQVFSADLGLPVSTWKVTTSSGLPALHNDATGETLVGTVEQILDEAAGGPRHNSGHNLSQFLGPNAFLSAAGAMTTLESSHLALDHAVIFGDSRKNNISGGGGEQTMIGGRGNDTYIVDNAFDHVVETRGGGSADWIRAAVSYTLSPDTHVEILSTLRPLKTNAINLTGNKYANTLIGNAGSNVLNGGLGADKMYGGVGDDTYFVDHNGELVFEAPGEGHDRVLASIDYVLPYDVEDLLAMSIAAKTPLSLTGNDLANTIKGNAGDNRLDGLGGDDTLIGGAGNDALFGGDGNDTLYFDAADDPANIQGGSDADVLIVNGTDLPTTFALDTHGFESAIQVFTEQAGQGSHTVTRTFDTFWHMTAETIV